MKQIRRLLSSEENPPVREVLASGVLPTLVALLESADAKVVFESAWALTNIASTEFTKAVVDAGALPKLVAGMMHADATVREQSLWCVGNISGDCPDFRDAVFTTPNAVNNLLMNVAHPENVRLLRNATWSLSNFCRGKPAPRPEAVAPIIPALAYLISLEDKDVLSDALWGLCYLTDGEEEMVTAVVGAGVLPRVVALLGHAELSVAMPALRIVGNVVSAADQHTQAAVDAGVVAALVPLLRSARRNVKREACWAISNVAAGTHAQIGAMLATPGLLQAVIETMRSAEWHVRKEAAWIVCNTAAAGTPEHVCRIVAAGIVEPLVDILNNDDARMLVVVMDAMEAILSVEAKFKRDGNPAAAMCRFAENFDEHGAVGRLEELQEHESEDVYKRSYALLKKYYYDEDKADEGGAGAENAAPFGAPAPAPAPAPFAAAAAAPAAAFGLAPAGGANIMAAFGVGKAPAVAAAPAAAGAGYSFAGVRFT